MCRGIVLSSNSVMTFVVILYISFAVILLRKRARKRLINFECFLLSCDCLCTVLFIIVMVECPCNINLFYYTDRKTDRLTGEKTDRQTDRQVNKLKHFFLFL